MAGQMPLSQHHMKRTQSTTLPSAARQPRTSKPPPSDTEQHQTNQHRYGHSLVQIDPKAEAKLRLKIDFMIVPTVALLYLFCFIDRANIGPSPSSSISCTL